jgi:hypothetical protein
MGLHLLKDLTHALAITVDPRSRGRLTEADLPALITRSKAAGLALDLELVATGELLRLAHRYDVYLVALSAWLVIPLPLWVPQADAGAERGDPEWWE